MKKSTLRFKAVWRGQTGSSSVGVLVGMGAVTVASILALQQHQDVAHSVKAHQISQASDSGKEAILNGLSVMKALLDPKVATADLANPDASGLPVIYNSNYFGTEWTSKLAPGLKLPAHVRWEQRTNAFAIRVPTTHGLDEEAIQRFLHRLAAPVTALAHLLVLAHPACVWS